MNRILLAAVVSFRVIYYHKLFNELWKNRSKCCCDKWSAGILIEECERWTTMAAGELLAGGGGKHRNGWKTSAHFWVRNSIIHYRCNLASVLVSGFTFCETMTDRGSPSRSLLNRLQNTPSVRLFSRQERTRAVSQQCQCESKGKVISGHCVWRRLSFRNQLRR